MTITGKTLWRVRDRISVEPLALVPDDGPAALLAPSIDLASFSADIRHQAEQLLAELPTCRKQSDIGRLRRALALLTGDVTFLDAVAAGDAAASGDPS